MDTWIDHRGALASIARLVCTTILGMTTAAVAGDPSCAGAGTVFGKIRIGQGAGGFGEGIAIGDRFGAAIAPLGDLDGNGVGDIAVGAPRTDDGGTDRGAVWILFLRPDGTVKNKQRISATSGGFGAGLANGDQFGSALASLGDLDGDGVPELAVGASTADDGGSNRGALWLLFLNSDGTVKSKQKISATSGGFGAGLANGDLFGASVASIGDLDGDGTADLVVGAPGTDDGGTDLGAVWIVFLDARLGVKAKQKISATSGGFGSGLSLNNNFGQSVASPGDLDGDGLVELAVGAYLDGDGAPGSGAVWILSLESDGTVASKQKISGTSGGLGPGLDAQDWFGVSLASLGDLDADGVGDLLVGACLDDDGGVNRGAVWILFLNSDRTVGSKTKVSQLAGEFGGPLADEAAFGSAVALLDLPLAPGRVSIACGAAALFAPAAPGELWTLSVDACPTGPVITVHPESVLLDAGGGVAQFEVVADAKGDLSYQWRKDGVALEEGGAMAGVGSSSLIVQATGAEVGVYDCVVSTVDGASLSRAAVLGIRSSCPGDLDGDGVVGGSDLGLLLAAWGLCAP